MIVNEEIMKYIGVYLPERSELMQRMEQEALAEHIPIIQPSSAQLLYMLVRMQKPRTIFEIGTAIGYSTLWLTKAAPEATIYSIDINGEWQARAHQALTEAGVREHVTLFNEDATLDPFSQWQTPPSFDFIFMDAAKGQYIRFMELYLPYLATDGVILTDNVLHHGLVTETHFYNRRKRQLVERIQKFNDYLANHPILESSWIPIGDGMVLSMRRRSTK